METNSEKGRRGTRTDREGRWSCENKEKQEKNLHQKPSSRNQEKQEKFEPTKERSS
jgi:hypothetical protein